MANRSLFRSLAESLARPGMTRNAAGGVAYAMTAEHILAQYAMTGCMNATYYASAEDQAAVVVELARHCDARFVAQIAVYARERGHMKDMPAILCAVLSSRRDADSGALLDRIFLRVVDSPRMLRTFVQIVRSGVAGRRSLGSRPKRLVQQWLASRSEEELFAASVGNAPSLVDILRMAHPRPQSPSREALYGYLLGKKHDPGLLPLIVLEFEAFKKSVQR
jgi:60 kDa SS-A/Ro ribonucleoprotein